jgi:glycosyltransferase involved in cell wall biosynthesis
MKICFVTNIYPPNYIGGPGEVVFNLQRYFLNHGHDAYVFTCGKTDQIYPCTIRTQGGKRLFPLISPLSYFRNVRKKDFDILNFQLESGMGIAPFLCLSRKPKVVTTLHSEHIMESKATQSIVVNGSAVTTPSLEEWLVKYFLVPAKLVGTYLDIFVSEKIIAVSDKTKEAYLRQNQIPREKISVIHNGVDSERFSPEISGNPVREAYTLGDSPVILIVGSNLVLKGVIYAFFALSEVVKIFPNVKLMVVGIEGNQKLKMLSMLHALKIQNNVILVGRVPNFKLPYFYSSSQFVLLPSLVENFPLVALEAMSSGKPLIASRVGGIPEIVDDNKTGVLFRPADVGQMVDSILRLLENPSLGESMGRNGRKKVEERFDWNKIGQMYLSEFQKLT